MTLLLQGYLLNALKKFRNWETDYIKSSGYNKDIGLIYEHIECQNNLEDISKEVDDLLYSGLSLYDLEKILLNCGPKDFVVNIFGSLLTLHVMSLKVSDST